MSASNWPYQQHKPTEDIIIELSWWEAICWNVKDASWEARLKAARWLYPDAFQESKSEMAWF